MMTTTISSAQQIVPDPNGRCEMFNANMSICNGVIPSNTFIYLNSSQTQDTLNQQATGLINILTQTSALCSLHAKLLYCSNVKYINHVQHITKHNQHQFHYHLFLAKVFAAQSVCHGHDSNIGLEFDCTGLGDAGQALFPTTATFYNLTQYSGDSNQSVVCNQLYVNPGLCPHPLIYVDSEMNKHDVYAKVVDSQCALTCPFDYWSKKSMNSLYYTQSSINGISFACGILLILLFGILPNEINQRMEIILSFGISSVCVAISYIMVANDRKDYCGSNNRYMAQSDPKCGFNGVLFQFGVNALTYWWTFLCYSFFKAIRMEKIKHFKYFRIILWGYALLNAVLPLIGSSYVANPRVYGCWMDARDARIWQILFYFAPAWICLLMILFFTVYSIYRVYMMYGILKDDKIMMFNTKQIVIMMVVTLNFVVVAFYTFYQIGRQKIYDQTMENWIKCLVVQGSDHCQLDWPDYFLRIMIAIVNTNNGIIGFLSYGLEYNCLVLLRKSNKVRWLRLKVGLSDLAPTSSDSSSSKPNAAAARRKSTASKPKPVANGIELGKVQHQQQGSGSGVHSSDQSSSNNTTEVVVVDINNNHSLNSDANTTMTSTSIDSREP
ncbi:hypothetical protein SAMD00019534_049980 [Acytostelium subglobosum LB1]|uniref:hypothetical protein n=1 Tax=Acytostelium subglobosum LB1 TaxID=1410327 RepID=UPI000644E323|nr:hypothetical protein SAMD00019534_049980 [Acytostelium subglobosum LB1]GAM21823.1 hypothetical protein SAMD00019534_049980 [Acytostelium subglobosum LB1]|eukprot:XP_012754923.1 hypothetical protein SAMD00019534_049980 [Acytostelium subglobosum LB1]